MVTLTFDDICRSKRVCVSWNNALEGRIGWLLQVNRLEIDLQTGSYCGICLINTDTGRRTTDDDWYFFSDTFPSNEDAEFQVVRFGQKLAAVLSNCGSTIRKLTVAAHAKCWESDVLLSCCRKSLADIFSRMTTYQTLEEACFEVHNYEGVGETLLSWEELLSCSRNLRVFRYREGVCNKHARMCLCYSTIVP